MKRIYRLITVSSINGLFLSLIFIDFKLFLVGSITTLTKEKDFEAEDPF